MQGQAVGERLKQETISPAKSQQFSARGQRSWTCRTAMTQSHMTRTGPGAPAGTREALGHGAGGGRCPSLELRAHRLPELTPHTATESITLVTGPLPSLAKGCSTSVCRTRTTHSGLANEHRSPEKPRGVQISQRFHNETIQWRREAGRYLSAQDGERISKRQKKFKATD